MSVRTGIEPQRQGSEAHSGKVGRIEKISRERKKMSNKKKKKKKEKKNRS